MSQRKRLEKPKVQEPDSDDEPQEFEAKQPTQIAPIENVPIVPTTLESSEDSPNKMPEVFKRRKYKITEEGKEARRQNLENARKVRAELAEIRANLKKEEIESKKNARQERLERIERERKLKMEQEIEEEVGRRVMRELAARPVQVRASSQTRRPVQVVHEEPPKPTYNVVFH